MILTINLVHVVKACCVSDALQGMLQICFRYINARASSAVLNIVKRVSGLLSSEWKHNRAGQEVKWDFLPTAAAAAAIPPQPVVAPHPVEN